MTAILLRYLSPTRFMKKKSCKKFAAFSAQNKTRTCTLLTAPAPQAGVSTNSTTWAIIQHSFLFRSPAIGEACARNRTRTCTSLRTLVPETSASTNSAIRALGDLKRISERRLGCKNNILFRKNNLSHKKTVPAYSDRDLVKP